jgi:poly-gamma-glutamate capsule biosynthesis protein CapA/YwtB (metallophosphatase superfamily)
MKKEDSLVIAAVGDIMLGSTYPDRRDLPPHNGKGMLDGVAPTLRAADLTFGNLEGPLADSGSTAKKGPNSYAFRVPTAYGSYLKDAGFDVFSLANNHASDFGASGRESTRRTLAKLGIRHAGSDRNDVAHLMVKGMRIAVVAFAHNQVSLNVNDLKTAHQAVASAAKQADFVLVSFHGGGEGSGYRHVGRGAEIYLGERRGELRKFTHTVIDAGAKMVVGHGPHLLRGMEFYKNRLIAYSLGNFATYGKFGLRGPTALSVILEVQVDPKTGAFQSGRLHPVHLVAKGIPKIDPNRTAIGEVRSLSQADFGKTAAVISKDGVIAAPR